MYFDTKIICLQKSHIPSLSETISHITRMRSQIHRQSNAFAPGSIQETNVASYYRLIKEKIQIGYRGVSYANFGASDELNQGEWKERRPRAIEVAAVRADIHRLRREPERWCLLAVISRNRPLRKLRRDELGID
jgi:hypothetical protein